MMKKCDCSWKWIVGIAAAVFAVAAAVAAIIIYRDRIAAFFSKIGCCCADAAEKIGSGIDSAKEKVVVKCSKAKDKVCPACEYTDEELSDFADV